MAYRLFPQSEMSFMRPSLSSEARRQMIGFLGGDFGHKGIEPQHRLYPRRYPETARRDRTASAE